MGRINLKDRVSHTRLGLKLFIRFNEINSVCYLFILFELFQVILFTQKIVPTVCSMEQNLMVRVMFFSGDLGGRSKNNF